MMEEEDAVGFFTWVDDNKKSLNHFLKRFISRSDRLLFNLEKKKPDPNPIRNVR